MTYEVSDRAGSQMTRLRLPALGVFPELGIRGTGPRQPKKVTVCCHHTDIKGTRPGGPHRGRQETPARVSTPGFKTRLSSLADLQHCRRPTERSQPSPTDRNTGGMASHPRGYGDQRHPGQRLGSWVTLACWAGRKLGALVPKSPGEGDSAQPRAGDHSRESLYAHYGMLCGHAEVTRGTDIGNMFA